MRATLLGLCWLALGFGCGSASSSSATVDDAAVAREAFEDHTRARLASVADFEPLAATEYGRQALKYVLTGLSTEAAGVRFLDARFYRLHDEWYWFRLLNGARVPGAELVQPPRGPGLPSIADCYAWARAQPQLPSELRWADGDRLYAPRFYNLALGATRTFGLGTLIHVPASASRPARWGFLLEFVDAPPPAFIARTFELLGAALPAEVRDGLVWVTRSQAQDALAQSFAAQHLPYADRVVRLKDLAEPGQTEVYAEGVAAGHLKLVRAGEPLTSTDDDVLVLEEVPDALPPAAGLITAVPQTPLAHLALLARNRGIPDAHLGGALDDLALHDLAYYRRPVVVRATLAGGPTITAITEAELSHWKELGVRPPTTVPPVDVATLPLTRELSAAPLSDTPTVRRGFGGKAAGFVALFAGAAASLPDRVVAVSIRPYVEHLAPFRTRLEAMLASATFREDRRVRALVLEGHAAYAERFPTPDDAAFAERFLGAHPPGDVLGDFARAGGVRGALRDVHVAPATLAELTQALTQAFGHYAPTQGLRFRSSSTAEDVEGFNGAGLYDSNTGFLDAAAQPSSSDRAKTVEAALLKTWASYWSLDAYDERALEAVDHLSGNMGVVVHARFDDAAERANGVFLLTLERGRTSLSLNVQLGALSVTNPTSTQLPEVDLVVQEGAAAPRVTRQRASTLAPAGSAVLSDEQLLSLFADARAVAARWLEEDNRLRPAAQKASGAVLDFEFRHVAAGWPQLRVGTTPSRLVLKQVRSLESGVRAVDPTVAALPIPHDVLTRAQRVERRSCEAAAFSATVVEVFTNPLAAPDLGFSTDAFTAGVSVRLAAPALGHAAGDVLEVDHTQLVTRAHLTPSWGLDASFEPAAPLTSVRLTALGLYRLAAGAQALEGSDVRCTRTVLFSTPTEYLLGLLERAGSGG